MNDAHKPPLEVYSAESLSPLRPGEVPPGYEYVSSTGEYIPLADNLVVGALSESVRAETGVAQYESAVGHGDAGGSPVAGLGPSADTGSESACPTCGRKPPAPKKQSKLRGSKTIKVPKDAQEDGVELLETLIAQVEGDLRPNERPRSPYYTLIEALYFFLTNAKKAAA